MKNPFARRKGFTLIELLLVIGIIAILAAIVIVAINPTKQLGDARDAQRRSDVNTMLNAIWQYAIDNGGAMPKEGTVEIDDKWRMIGSAGAGCDAVPDPAGSNNRCKSPIAIEGACLFPLGLTGTYVVNLPGDPRWGSGSLSRSSDPPATRTFYIVQNNNNRVTVRSCYDEQASSAIEVTR